uniref:Uncharacterized protein n=1 Tax=Romanomermis culicivorax TaxID=13658 RepID=A0A915I5R6_ROMCU
MKQEDTTAPILPHVLAIYFTLNLARHLAQDLPRDITPQFAPSLANHVAHDLPSHSNKLKKLLNIIMFWSVAAIAFNYNIFYYCYFLALLVVIQYKLSRELKFFNDCMSMS